MPISSEQAAQNAATTRSYIEKARIAIAERRAKAEALTKWRQDEVCEVEFIAKQFPSTFDQEKINGEEVEVATITTIVERTNAETLAENIRAFVSTIDDKAKKDKPSIVWARKQLEARSLILSGKSCVIIGKAGTGKTTLVRETLGEMIRLGMIPPLRDSTKWLTSCKPGCVVLSFTNKAVANIARGMPKDITCVTAHKLIEFEPHFYTAIDAEGEQYKTMRFEPSKTALDPLPRSLRVVVFEESGNIGTDLFEQITDALNSGEQFVFLGDINQLPPVFGAAILGFKMLELPVVELDEIFRQADTSPILAFSWEMLDGKPMTIDYITKKYEKEDEFIIRPWAKKVKPEKACDAACRTINACIDNGKYNSMTDMILVPFNKVFGTIEMNLQIAQKLGDIRNAEVHEIIAGFTKRYLAIGDKVLVNKQEALIEKISRNGLYGGKEPLSPSTKLNRWGMYNFDSKDAAAKDIAEHQMGEEELMIMLAATDLDSGNIDEKKNQASHILHCRMIDSEEEVEVQTTAEFAECLFAYVLTVYKAQGSEWDKVFLFLHESHATALCRELLYTAVTRAKKSLVIVCEPEHFVKGILRQRIRGNTLEEKAEYFKGKLDNSKATEEE